MSHSDEVREVVDVMDEYTSLAHKHGRDTEYYYGPIEIGDENVRIYFDDDYPYVKIALLEELRE